MIVVVLASLLGTSYADGVRPATVHHICGRYIDTVPRCGHSQSHGKLRTSSKQKMLAQLLFAQSSSAAYMPSARAALRLPKVCPPCKTIMTDRTQTDGNVTSMKPQPKLARHSVKEQAFVSTLQRTRSDIWQEAKDLWRFICHPTPGPRLPGRYAGPTVLSDIFSCWKTLRRVLFWSLVLCANSALHMKLILLIDILFPTIGIAALWNGLYDIGFQVALGVFLAPTREELWFRYPLRQLPPLWLLPAAHFVGTHSTALLMLLPQFQGELAVLGLEVESDVLNDMALDGIDMVVATVLLRLFMTVVGGYMRPVRKRVRNIFLRHYRAVVYFNCVIFALAHLNNLDLSCVPNKWLLPLLVLPQLTGSFVLAWLRVRCGIGASIVAHILHNVWGYS